jgi:hypothetical protein
MQARKSGASPIHATSSWQEARARMRRLGNATSPDQRVLGRTNGVMVAVRAAVDACGRAGPCGRPSSRPIRSWPDGLVFRPSSREPRPDRPILGNNRLMAGSSGVDLPLNRLRDPVELQYSKVVVHAGRWQIQLSSQLKRAAWLTLVVQPPEHPSASWMAERRPFQVDCPCAVHSIHAKSCLESVENLTRKPP